MKDNKFKFLGIEFKSVDSFLITLYVILVAAFPLIFGININSSFYLGITIIIAILIILSIFITYIVIFTRNIKYNKTIEEKKFVLKSFIIANILIFGLLLTDFIILEIIRCKNYGEACGLGLTIAIIAFILPVFLVMIFLVLIMSIPWVIAKIK